VALSPRRMSFTDRQFGKLTILTGIKPDIFLCKCVCGRTVERWRSQLANNVSRDCGCETSIGPHHGHTRFYRTRSGKKRLRTSAEYNSYKNMVERCREHPVAREEWPNYGGRGIRVCKQWLLPHGEGFKSFLESLGPRPAGMTLDRKDPQGHYEPSNCRWADKEVQAQNQRRYVYPDGEPPLEDYAAMEARIEEEYAESNPY
jgi:hypothetical protein